MMKRQSFPLPKERPMPIQFLRKRQANPSKIPCFPFCCWAPWMFHAVEYFCSYFELSLWLCPSWFILPLSLFGVGQSEEQRSPSCWASSAQQKLDIGVLPALLWYCSKFKLWKWHKLYRRYLIFCYGFLLSGEDVAIGMQGWVSALCSALQKHLMLDNVMCSFREFTSGFCNCCATVPKAWVQISVGYHLAKLRLLSGKRNLEQSGNKLMRWIALILLWTILNVLILEMHAIIHKINCLYLIIVSANYLFNKLKGERAECLRLWFSVVHVYIVPLFTLICKLYP